MKFSNCFGRLLVIAFASSVWSQYVQVSTEPTPQLKEIFLGKCWEYIYIINPEVGYKNCNDLWQKFHDSFAYKDPCGLSPEDYHTFAEAAQTPLPENRHMFWEETYEFVHAYSDRGKRAVSISDTLLGYMANGLVWCGQLEEPGINYTNCTCVEADDAVLSYWKGVSSYYASNASGVTHVMLNGSIEDAFPVDGVFSMYELANLNPDEVHEVHALIVHEIGLPVKESCTNGSLIQLKEKVEDLGFTYKCTDDRASFRCYAPKINIVQIVKLPTLVTVSEKGLTKLANLRRERRGSSGGGIQAKFHPEQTLEAFTYTKIKGLGANESDLLHLMCVDYPDAPECNFQLSTSSAIFWKSSTLLVLLQAISYLTGH